MTSPQPLQVVALVDDPAGQPIGCHLAEQWFVGVLLHMTCEQAAPHLERIHADDLLDPRHRLILEAARGLVAQGVAPDPVAVLGELRRHGADRSFLDDRAAGVHLVELHQLATIPASAGTYLTVILEHSLRRRVEAAGVRLQQAAGASSLDGLLQTARDEFYAIGAAHARLTGGTP